MLKESYPCYIANEPVASNQDLEVIDKFTGEVATRVALASPEDIEHAISGTVEATKPMARMRGYERQAVLMHCVARFTERAEELAEALCIEAGSEVCSDPGDRVLAESLLSPIQVEAQIHLGFDLVDILTTWPTRAGSAHGQQTGGNHPPRTEIEIT